MRNQGVTPLREAIELLREHQAYIEATSPSSAVNLRVWRDTASFLTRYVLNGGEFNDLWRETCEKVAPSKEDMT